jgi:hypothetical protein
MAVDLKVLADDLERIGKEMLEAASILREGDTAKPESAEQKEPIPLEKVRSVLADKSRLGHTAEIKALLKKRGAVKLSEVDPAEYAALLAEAEALT